ncbi:hypothetical protein ES703_12197 [subsurface metagenome]
MPVGIIDPFEFVQVDHKNGDSALLFFSLSQMSRNHFLQVPTVVYLRQLISIEEAIQFLAFCFWAHCIFQGSIIDV